MGRHRAAAGRDLPGARVSLARFPARRCAGASPCSRRRRPSPALLWWRGPDWHTVWHAFDAVKWYWVAGAIGLNLLSVVTRAFAWRTVINQAIEPPHPRYMTRLLGVLGRPVRERGATWAHRRAGARGGADAEAAAAGARRRHLGRTRRDGLRASPVRPRADGAADPLRGRHGEDPALGDREPGGRRHRRLRAVRVRVRERAASQPVGARGARAGAAAGRDGRGTVSPSYTPRARRRSRRSSRRSAGSASSSRSTSRCGPSTSTRRCRRPRSCCC